MVAGSLIGVKADQLEVPINDSSFDSPLDFFFKIEIVENREKLNSEKLNRELEMCQ